MNVFIRCTWHANRHFLKVFYNKFMFNKKKICTCRIKMRIALRQACWKGRYTQFTYLHCLLACMSSKFKFSTRKWIFGTLSWKIPLQLAQNTNKAYTQSFILISRVSSSVSGVQKQGQMSQVKPQTRDCDGCGGTLFVLYFHQRIYFSLHLLFSVSWKFLHHTLLMVIFYCRVYILKKCML